MGFVLIDDKSLFIEIEQLGWNKPRSFSGFFYIDFSENDEFLCKFYNRKFLTLPTLDLPTIYGDILGHRFYTNNVGLGFETFRMLGPLRNDFSVCSIFIRWKHIHLFYLWKYSCGQRYKKSDIFRRPKQSAVFRCSK